MNTNYDKVYSTFLDNCMVSDIDLPKTPEQIYRMINNAVLLFNNDMRTSITCDDSNELLSIELTEDDLLILAHFIRLAFLKNQLTLYVSTWQPFDKDMGIRNYRSQVQALQRVVKDTEEDIKKLKRNMEEDIF